MAGPDPTKPSGTIAELEEHGRSKRFNGACAPRRTGQNIPEDERQMGCPEYDRCTLKRKGRLIKGHSTFTEGVSGPVNCAYQVLKDKKEGGIARQGWGACFDVLRLKEQFRYSQNVLFQITGFDGTVVEVPGSRPRRDEKGVIMRRDDGTAVMEDYSEEVTVPVFERIGQSRETKTAAYMKRIREKIERDREAALEAKITTMAAPAEDEEAFT